MGCGGCIFCSMVGNFPESLIDESEHSYAIYDKYPREQGHALVITKQHFENLSKADDESLKDAISLVKKVAFKLKEKYPKIKGFNYASNEGAAAKQEIFHLHIHIIPRY